jgi:hypothetical protein
VKDSELPEMFVFHCICVLTAINTVNTGLQFISSLTLGKVLSNSEPWLHQLEIKDNGSIKIKREYRHSYQ